MRSPAASTLDGRSSANGASGSSNYAWRAWKSATARADPGLLPPEVIVQVKALACELPTTLGLPRSRRTDVAREACRSGIVTSVSAKTVWRWLHEDAIRPWQHRCWIVPRDPDFAAGAGRMLDLCARRWNGRRLREDDFVVSAAEKTSIQARARVHLTLPPRPGAPNSQNASANVLEHSALPSPPAQVTVISGGYLADAAGPADAQGVIRSEGSYHVLAIRTGLIVPLVSAVRGSCVEWDDSHPHSDPASERASAQFQFGQWRPQEQG